MAWWKKKSPPLGGSVYLRGGIPPRPENYEGLRQKGIEVSPLEASPGTLWKLQLTHPTWGRAELIALRDTPMPPASVLQMDSRLSMEDKLTARFADSAVSVMYHPSTSGILRERKHLFRFLHAVTTPAAVIIADHNAQAFWSIPDVEDELSHDADVDIQWLFTIHAVTGDNEKHVWAHTHGLRDLGFTDFDILNPSQDLWGSGYDMVRALAYAIVEEKLLPDGPAFDLAHPDGRVQLVSSSTMLGRGKDLPPEWPGMLDDDHRKGHAVVCNPVSKTLGILPGRPKPSTYFSNPIPPHSIVFFTRMSTDLMAERAKGTLPVFRKLMDEFQGLRLPILVKLGYTIDSGGPDDREHLWFNVHSCDDNVIDATLQNRPRRIARLHEGQRGSHPTDLLTDWMIMTPLGNITPRNLRLARNLRRHKDEIVKMLKDPPTA